MMLRVVSTRYDCLGVVFSIFHTFHFFHVHIDINPFGILGNDDYVVPLVVAPYSIGIVL